MFIFGILSNLLFLAILGAIGYAIVKGVSGRRAQGGAETAPGSLRRLFMFGSLYGAVHIAAWGTAGFADAASTSGTIAEPLAVIIVAVPVAAILARWAWRTVADPLERGPAFGLYLNLMSFTALLVLMITGFAVGTWLIADNSLPEFELAAFFVWAGVWLAHWLVWKHYEADVFNLHLFLGSAAGLMLTAISAAIMLTFAFQELLDATTSIDLASHGGDDFRRPLVGLIIGGAVLGWYWFANAARARRDSTWYGYVMLIGVLTGLIAAVAGAGITAYGALQWLWGEPDATSAVRHFDDFAPALAVFVIGAAGWSYHRLVVLRDAPAQRTEVLRVYDYVVAGVGLVTATVGAVLLLVGAQEALFPPEDGGRFESSINMILGAVTALAVGAPLWYQAWRRAHRHTVAEPELEVSSPTRRSYLFGVLGVSGVVVFGSLISLLVAIFNNVFEETRDPLRDEVQVPIALLLAVGAVGLYHLQTMWRERGIIVPPPIVKDVMLVTGDVALASLVQDLTGARVRVLHRLDTDGDLLDPAAVADAVAADEHEHLLVLAGPRGGVEVVPYEG